MSIPFQIICDSYTQVFYAFNIFQYSALKGVVSLNLTRPFICQLSGRANFFRGQGATGLSGHLRSVISLQEGRHF